MIDLLFTRGFIKPFLLPVLHLFCRYKQWQLSFNYICRDSQEAGNKTSTTANYHSALLLKVMCIAFQYKMVFYKDVNYSLQHFQKKVAQEALSWHPQVYFNVITFRWAWWNTLMGISKLKIKSITDLERESKWLILKTHWYLVNS